MNKNTCHHEPIACRPELVEGLCEEACPPCFDKQFMTPTPFSTFIISG
jgi:hypothetical protein